MLPDPGLFLLQRDRFLGASRGRKLIGRGVKNPPVLCGRNLVLNAEVDQFLEDVIALAGTGMAIDLASSHHLEGNPAEAPGDLDAGVAGILVPEPPRVTQNPEVFITPEQIVGDERERVAKIAIGTANQLAIAAIDLVALVP